MHLLVQLCAILFQAFYDMCIYGSFNLHIMETIGLIALSSKYVVDHIMNTTWFFFDLTCLGTFLKVMPIVEKQICFNSHLHESV